MAQADALDIHHDTVQLNAVCLAMQRTSSIKRWEPADLRGSLHGAEASIFDQSFPHLYGHGLQVELGCSREFAKAYAFARCGLAAAYQNLSQLDICHYAAANLSAVSIRLGE